MNVLLLAIGSHGDVHPFVGIGKRLRQRGHSVTIAANELFESVVSGAGLNFVELGTAAQYEQIASDPAMWGRMKGFHVVMGKGVLPGLRLMYELVMEFAQRDDTVVAGSTLALGMRIAEDKLKTPMALVHLSPAILRSVHETPLLPGFPVRSWMPAWMKGWAYWLADTLVIDRVMKGQINALRREVGLPSIGASAFEWWNDAGVMIGMWPGWFAAPQPDWPAQLRTTGFALYDEKERRPIGEELLRFLDGGEAPVAFTAGSAMWSEHHFFEESAAACRRLGCRGILLSKRREMVPVELPRNVIHISYAPFGELFARCAAVVHHGGIGTTAQALASGARQIVMPLAHDQLDNANRVVRLGCGRWVEPGAYRAVRVAQVLGEILSDQRISGTCQQVSRRFADSDGIGDACAVIEQLKSPASGVGAQKSDLSCTFSDQPVP